MKPVHLILCLLITNVVLAFSLTTRVSAAEPVSDFFSQTWERTDRPVANGAVSRTWMWGDSAFSVPMRERYGGSYLPNAPSFPNQRFVQYFDKSRMEITNPGADPTSPWYVTNGLLVMELITGRMQVSDIEFQDRLPATVNVAGDYDDPLGPTYASFSSHLNDGAEEQETTLTRVIHRDGTTSDDDAFAAYSVPTTSYVPETGHWIAGPFWDFMNSTGTVYESGTYTTAPLFLDPFYATGFPVTDAFWANVKVADAYTDVLIQCFERRCLTYTPANDPAWRVEAGNVGQHYYSWRYGWGLAVGSGDYEIVRSFGNQNIPGTPKGVAYAPDDTIVVADQAAGQLLRFDGDGRLTQRIGEAGIGNDQFFSPLGVAVDDAGSIYATDEGSGRVLKFGRDGRFLRSWGPDGSGHGDYFYPAGIAVSSDGRIYVSDASSLSIRIFDAQGNLLSRWDDISTHDDSFGHPHAIAIASDGSVFVNIATVQDDHNRIDHYTHDGSYLGSWDIPIGSSTSIAVDAAGIVFVPDALREQVLRFTSDGTELPAWPLPSPSEDASTLDLGGIVSSDAGRLYITDSSSHRVMVLDADGELAAEWSQQGLLRPVGIVANADGSYFVGDADKSTIVQFDASGVDIAEFGQTVINAITDLALTANGDLLVLDDWFSTIHRFNQQGEYQSTIDLTESLGVPESEFLPVALTADPSSGEIFVLTEGIYHPAHGRTSRVYRYAADGSFITSWIVSRPRDKDPEPSGYGIDFLNGQIFVTSDTVGLAVYPVDGSESTEIPGFSAAAIAAGDDGTLWLNRNVHTPTGDIEFHLQQIDLTDGTILRDWSLEGVVTSITIDHTSDHLLITRVHDPGILVYAQNTGDASSSIYAEQHHDRAQASTSGSNE